MNTLEVIHVRFSGADPETLAESIKDAVGTLEEEARINIYRHNKVETDLVVHLCRDGGPDEGHRSILGSQLAFMLRRYGMVEHSVWVEMFGTGGTLASPIPS